jgi:hypothetical protein
MDILVEPSPENARKILEALQEFGFSSLPLSEEDFTEPGQIIQLGYEPVRIDLFTPVKGIDFQEIWKNRALGQYGRQQVFFIGFNDLVSLKRDAGRSQDRADLEVLQAVLKKSD